MYYILLLFLLSADELYSSIIFTHTLLQTGIAYTIRDIKFERASFTIDLKVSDVSASAEQKQMTNYSIPQQCVSLKGTVFTLYLHFIM